MNLFWAMLCALSGGSLLSVSGAANARLGHVLRSALAAATVSFLVGATTLTLLLSLGGVPSVPPGALIGVPPWALGGGTLGALYVTLCTLVIPRLGLTATTMTVVLSQLISSLLIDHSGWLGVPRRPIGPAQWLAVLLLLLAVAMRRNPPASAPEGSSDD
jgi:transporter family-2 protein